MLNISVSLRQVKTHHRQLQEWWIVNQTERGPIEKSQNHDDCLELYVFSDQVSPPSLGFLAGYGYDL